MDKLNFNRRLSILLIIAIQAMLLLIFLFSSFKFSPYDYVIFSELQAVKSLYVQSNVDWICIVKIIAHIVCGILNAVSAFFAIRYGLRRKTEMFQFLMITIGIHFSLSAILNFSMIGQLFVGGLWHIFSTVFILIMVFSSLAALIILFIYRDHLRAFANWQDRIATDEERELVKELAIIEMQDKKDVT